MQKIPLSLFLSFIFLSDLTAQSPDNPGARSASLAESSVCLSDTWAFYHNPGALASVSNFSAGLSYDSRFLTRELQHQALALAVPTRVGVISAGAQLKGYEQYRRTRAGLGYALGLGEHFSAGIQVNLHQLRLGGNYGSSLAATCEAGVLATISDKWKVGAAVANIGRQRITPALSDLYASSLRMGVSYEPSKKVLITSEIAKEVIYPVSFRTGIEYKPAECFVLRAGARTAPVNLAFGIGYRKKGFCIDAGSAYQQLLGFTPHFGFTFELQK